MPSVRIGQAEAQTRTLTEQINHDWFSRATQMVDRDSYLVVGGANRLQPGGHSGFNGHVPHHDRHSQYGFSNNYPGANCNARPQSHAYDRAAGGQWDAPVL